MRILGWNFSVIVCSALVSAVCSAQHISFSGTYGDPSTWTESVDFDGRTITDTVDDTCIDGGSVVHCTIVKRLDVTRAVGSPPCFLDDGHANCNAQGVIGFGCKGGLEDYCIPVSGHPEKDRDNQLYIFCPSRNDCNALWSAITANSSPPQTSNLRSSDDGEHERQRAQQAREAKARQAQSDAERLVAEAARLVSLPRTGTGQNNTSALDQLLAQILSQTSNPTGGPTNQASALTSANMLDQLVDSLSKNPQNSDPLDQLVDYLRNKPTDPSPRPVADCAGLPVDDTFLRDAQASGDKCTCWKAGTYTVKGAMSGPMYQDATVSGQIENNDGAPSSTGGNLRLRNLSGSHNVYYGISGVINGKLTPGGSTLIGLSMYQTIGREQAVAVDVSLRYCKN